MKLRKNKHGTQKDRSLSSAHKLLKDSWRLLATYKGVIFGVVSVNIVVNLALIILASSSMRAIYQSLWFVFASCALIWTVRHLGTKTPPTVRQAYWVGTSPALKFLIVLSVLVLIGVPLSLGAFIFGTIGWLVSTTPLLRAAAALVWVAFSLVTLLLLARLVLGLVIATLPQVGPFESIGLSWRLARGQTYKIASRLFILFCYSLIVVGLVSLGLGAWPLTKNAAGLISQIIAWGLVLPFIYIFIFKIYQEIA